MTEQACVYCSTAFDNDKNLCPSCGKAQPERAVPYNENPKVLEALVSKKNSEQVAKTIGITCLTIIALPIILVGGLFIYLMMHPNMHI